MLSAYFTFSCRLSAIFQKSCPLGILIFFLFASAGCQPFLGSRQSGPQVTRSKNPCIVLALPASGPYAPLASKVKRGAEAARQELKKSGINAHLQDINTEASDWLAKLAALPEMCAVVGGPLQDKKYMEARKAGALQRRVFLSFLPTLAKGDEGVQAWRFFPSPQDQIDALVNFATDQMDIRTYGAFYPTDNYGRRMSDMLGKKLANKHMPLQKAAYNPNAPATWSSSVKTLILPRMLADGKTIVPGTAFEALFVPDSWKRMDGITASLKNNGEDRLVLLGTNIWEQGLSGKQPVKAGTCDLAVFPVAWNRANAPAALKKGNYDFWSALGYDFVQFAGRMGLAAKPDGGAVTALAQETAPMLKAMAPISWNNNGIGSQRMFIYQPTPGGMIPVNVEQFKKNRTAIAEKAALRMQGWGHIDPDSGEALPNPREVATPNSEGVETGEIGHSPAQTMEPQMPLSVPAVQQTGAASRPASFQPNNPHPVASQTQGQMPAQAAPMQSSGQAIPGVMSSKPRPSYKLSLPVRQ